MTVRRILRALAWAYLTVLAVIAVDAFDQRIRKGWWANRKIIRQMDRWKAAEAAKWQGVTPWHWRMAEVDPR